MDEKQRIDDLAVFGGPPLFRTPRSTSNLVRPDINVFLGYTKALFDPKHARSRTSIVEDLERELARFHETKYCVALSNGFWTLALAMKYLAMPGKTEIVMPSLTYRRMADVAAWARLTPHYCEVDPETLAMSAETAEPCINQNTALLLAVHPIVNCCDIEGLVALSKRKQVPILVDAVESAYETAGGKKVGSFGNAECFSLHASKLINGFEGGYLTTNDKDLVTFLLEARNPESALGRASVQCGIDARMNEVHAAMALASLQDLHHQVERNKHRYMHYKRLLEYVPGIELLAFNEKERCSYKNIVVRLTSEWKLSREVTLSILQAENAIARPYYSPPLHLKPAEYMTIFADMPITERLACEFVLLPCGYFVSDDDTESIVALLLFMHSNADELNSRRVTQ